MKAFDTDIVTEILMGNALYRERLAAVPADEQAITIVTVEEIVRGRLNTVRQAESGKGRISIHHAYFLLEQTLADFREIRVLSFSEAADVLLKEWRTQKVTGSTHDLRIAAICVINAATLVTRNRRDFERVPGLAMEVWD